MKYKVTLNGRTYEIEVEAGKAMCLDEYEAIVPLLPLWLLPLPLLPPSLLHPLLPLHPLPLPWLPVRLCPLPCPAPF